MVNRYQRYNLDISGEVIEKIKCPICGFVFSKMHSRAMDCGFVRCPRCDYEIPHSINEDFAHNLKNYYDQFGWSYRR
ncbi:MAG: hypothetical protein ACTSR3_10595 [Candidatus Helarchaeota archaeon]